MAEAAVFFLLAFVASYVGVAGVRRWAILHQALDIPNERSSHTQPTPRGGGLIIGLVTMTGIAALGCLILSSASRPAVAAYICGASLIAAVGWLDDLYSLSVRMRFLAQSLAAVIAVLAIGYWQAIPLLPGESVWLGYAGAALTFVWIVGLTNAYNFMDGSDGIAGLLAVLAGLGWACLGWLAGGSPTVTCLSLLLEAGSLGFLAHNWPPAKIFMGDVGSAFLGYSFATMPLLALGAGGPLAETSSALGLLLVWPFVFDAGFTFLRRLRNGENVFAAHRSHLYQRLLIVGYSHRFVMLLYGALATIGVFLGIAWLLRPVVGYWCSISLLPSMAWALHRFVVIQERRAEEITSQPPQIIPITSRKRRAA